MKDTLKIEQYDDKEDLFITIPPHILQQLKWEEGTEVEWKIEGDSIIVQDTKKPREESSDSIIIAEGTEEDWYDFWYNSESEGKEYKETLGQVFHSPEGQGSWH